MPDVHNESSPGDVASLPGPIREDGTHVHLFQARGAGVLLADQRPPAYALVMKQVLAHQLHADC